MPSRVSDEKETVMQSNLELFGQALTSKLKEAVATAQLRDSIRIHQVADPIHLREFDTNARGLPGAA
jgi:hypothetical protein